MGIHASSQAGAAAVLSFSGIGGAALANELDILNQPPPGTQHVIDDAGVLNKTTRKGLNDELSRLEVGSRSAPSLAWILHTVTVVWHPRREVKAVKRSARWETLRMLRTLTVVAV